MRVNFTIFPDFSCQWSSQNYRYKTTFGIFEILSFRFQIHHCTLWRNQKPQLSGKRANVEQNGVEFGTRG